MEKALTPMKIVNVITTLPWNENSAVRWNKRATSKIKQIVVHQALGTKTVQNTNAYHISKECHVSPGIGLPHIAYHFFIDYPSGTVYQCNDYADITWHIVNKNTMSLGICMGGFFNYDGIKCRDGGPSQAQLDSLKELLVYLTSLLPSTKGHIIGHCEGQNKPSCPGIMAMEYLEKIKKDIV